MKKLLTYLFIAINIVFFYLESSGRNCVPSTDDTICQSNFELIECKALTDCCGYEPTCFKKEDDNNSGFICRCLTSGVAPCVPTGHKILCLKESIDADEGISEKGCKEKLNCCNNQSSCKNSNSKSGMFIECTCEAKSNS